MTIAATEAATGAAAGQILLQQAYTLYRGEQYDAATEIARQVLAIDPADANGLYLLGMIYHAQKNHQIGITLLHASDAIDASAEVRHNMGLMFTMLGDLTSAAVCFRRALRLQPDYQAAQANLIYALDLHPESTPALVLAERRRFNDQFCARLTREAAPHTNNRDPNRVLKIGFVSGDFRFHSASIAFKPLIECADEKRVKLYLYSTGHPSKHDHVTARFMEKADVWSEVWDIDDEQLADEIRKDGIDVLVDLTAYSKDGRLLTFARKPAPIQITGIGYATGTGLDCMDYLISDSITIPPAHEDRYAEKIMRLPCLVGYMPGGNVPDVGPPPCEKNGHVTFGYLGRADKLNDRVMGVWAEIMRRVPGSKLLLKADSYRESAIRDKVIDPLVALGVDERRFVEMRGGTKTIDHLRTHNDVDIALDSFPAGGGATTLDACMMGVPTVTMLGEWVPSRQTAAIIHHADPGHSPPRTIDEYIDYAVTLANDRERLAMYRRTLRPTLQASPVMDGPRYARAFERRVRDAWREWVRAQKQQDAAAA